MYIIYIYIIKINNNKIYVNIIYIYTYIKTINIYKDFNSYSTCSNTQYLVIFRLGIQIDFNYTFAESDFISTTLIEVLDHSAVNFIVGCNISVSSINYFNISSQYSLRKNNILLPIKKFIF